LDDWPLGTEVIVAHVIGPVGQYAHEIVHFFWVMAAVTIRYVS
jgi:hypothetical protein